MDEHSILVMRGVGVTGYHGAPEVANVRAPARLIARGNRALRCLGDGRQSGTSACPSILHAWPEAALRGGFVLLKTGDRIRIDLGKGEVSTLLCRAELEAGRSALGASCVKAHANAVLESWYAGEEGGTVIAETGSGRNNPAGRLPVTFHRDVSQMPPFED